MDANDSGSKELMLDDALNCWILLDQQMFYLQSGKEQVSLNPRYDCHIELLCILKKERCSSL